MSYLPPAKIYKHNPNPYPNHKQDDKPSGESRCKGKPKGKPRGANKGARDDKAKSFSARPTKPEKKIDPDNPFAAALMGLKSGK